MAVTLTKEFWTNFVLFVVVCIALGLSIWAFATPCKKDKFGEVQSPCDAYGDTCLKISNDGQYFTLEQYRKITHDERKALKSQINIVPDQGSLKLLCYTMSGSTRPHHELLYPYKTNNKLFNDRKIFSTKSDAEQSKYWSIYPCDYFNMIN